MMKTGMLLAVLLTAAEVGQTDAQNPYPYAIGSHVAAYPRAEVLEVAEGDLFLDHGPALCDCGGESWFKVKTVQFMSGYYTSDTGLGLSDLEFDWVPFNLRFGCVLGWPANRGGSLRGHFEPILELTGASVVRGPGSYLGGAAFLYRYNFHEPGASRWLPYAQCGTGFVLNDAHEDLTQRAIGQEFEFTLQAGGGLKYMLRPNLSIDVEVNYFHISNADLAERNLGINAIGGLLGLTWYFR